MTQKLLFAAAFAIAGCSYAVAQTSAAAPPAATLSVSLYGLLDVSACDKHALPFRVRPNTSRKKASDMATGHPC